MHQIVINQSLYLVAEQIQDGSLSAGKSQLIELTGPVPEPETYVMLLESEGLTGVIARRRKSRVV